MDENLQAELDAIRAVANPIPIEPDDWESTAESLIRRTIQECLGRDPRVLNLTLLCRYPFAADQTEAKTIWYNEIRRQLGTIEPVVFESPRSIRGQIPRDDWAETVRTILRETIESCSPYSKQDPQQWSGDTKKLEAFILELKRRLPFEMDPEETGDPRVHANQDAQDSATYHRDFQIVWYQECARALGFQAPKFTPPPATVEPPRREKSREKQMKLF